MLCCTISCSIRQLMVRHGRTWQEGSNDDAAEESAWRAERARRECQAGVGLGGARVFLAEGGRAHGRLWRIR